MEKCYAIQAGREIRILVKPDVIRDDEMVIAAREIAKRIESELEYPGQIKVNMIRESRAMDHAKRMPQKPLFPQRKGRLFRCRRRSVFPCKCGGFAVQ